MSDRIKLGAPVQVPHQTDRDRGDARARDEHPLKPGVLMLPTRRRGVLAAEEGSA